MMQPPGYIVSFAPDFLIVEYVPFHTHAITKQPQIKNDAKIVEANPVIIGKSKDSLIKKLLSLVNRLCGYSYYNTALPGRW